MKRALTVVLILSLALALVACGSDEPCTHQWGEAECTQYPVCTLCGEKSAKAQEHVWQDATTDAPKTCSVCKITEGEPLSLDGIWKGTAQFFPIYFGVETEANRTIDAKMTLVLDEDGMMELTLEYDKENYDSCMAEIYVAMIYSGGASKEEVDAEYMETYGMTVEDFAAQKALEVAPAGYKETHTYTYYLEGNKLLYGDNMYSMDRTYRYSLEEDTLVLRDDVTDMVYDLSKVS